VLFIILATQMMIIVDMSVILTALPKMHRALGFSEASLSWVQNAYTLTFGGLLLLGARAGDLLGRRRVFIAGITLFTLASMAGGLAQSEGWMLIARALQGIGAAIAAPSALALLTTTYREPAERTRALTLYAAVSGASGSLGLVLGGMLTDWVSWRWSLFLNVPLGLSLVALAPRHLPETARVTGRFDLTGALTSTIGMSSLVYAFVRAGEEGWGDGVTLAAFSVALTLLAAFVATELRAEQPITPMRLFASRERSGAYAARVLMVGAVFSMFFFLTQYLQNVHGYDPLRSGLAFLPQTVMIMCSVRFVPRLAARLPASTLTAGALAIAALSMAWLSRVSATTAYFPGVAVPLLGLGVGIGTAFIGLTAAGVAGVEPRDAGAASGLVNAAHQLGGSLGLGVMVAVFSAATNHATGDARDTLAHGIATAFTGSAVLLVAALLVALVVIVRPARGTERVVAARAEAS